MTAPNPGVSSGVIPGPGAQYEGILWLRFGSDSDGGAVAAGKTEKMEDNRIAKDANSMDEDLGDKVSLYFSRVQATLQPALSVGWSVGWSVTFYFFLWFYIFDLTAPAQMV